MATVTTDHKWLQLSDEVVARYNYFDCLAAARATTSIKRQLARNQQLHYFEQEVWPLLPAVLAMQRRGLPYNSTVKGTYRKQLRRELAQCDTRLRQLYAKTADYQAELAEIARITELVNNPPEGKEGQKYRVRQTKGIILTKAEETRLGRRLPKTWNPNSDDQVRQWLFGDLGLRPSTHTAGGKPSVDMDALGRIYRNLRKKDEPARPALWDLMHRARLQKIDQDYLDPEVSYGEEKNRPKESTTGSNPSSRAESFYVRQISTVRGDNRSKLGDQAAASGRYTKAIEEAEVESNKRYSRGRVYPTVKMTGTESGRFSYANPPVHSWPEEIRHIVEAGDGKVWLGADYKQVEARVFSILTNDTRDLEILEKYDTTGDPEWDLHTRTSAELFGWTVQELLSKPTHLFKGARDYAKNFRYGVLLYGGGPLTTKAKVGCPCPRCADKAPPTVEVSPAERKRHAERWFNLHPNVYQWREQVSYQVMRQHSLTSPLGQKWYFLKPWSNETQREAWNRMIQGTAAGIIHRAMRKLHTLGCPLCLQHHDALYAEVPSRDLNYWANTMKLVMEQPIAELENRQFPVEVTVGPSWGEMEPWES